MKFSEFTGLLADLLPRDNRPIVAYSGLFSIAREFPPPANAVPQQLLQSLLHVVGPNRTVLMPTYSLGFTDGVVDLDSTPCNTGMMNELLRQTPGARRTRSAFFSFAALGPDAEALAVLRPVDAWGEGSVFDWIHAQDAQIVMMGVPWAMCSFLHIVEWLGAVPYRYLKTFSGECVIDGRRETLTERLFVRSLDPVVHNKWDGLEGILEASRMRRVTLGRGQVATIGSQALVRALLPIIRANPFAFVEHPDAMRAVFAVENGQQDKLLTANRS